MRRHVLSIARTCVLSQEIAAAVMQKRDTYTEGIKAASATVEIRAPANIAPHAQQKNKGKPQIAGVSFFSLPIHVFACLHHKHVSF